MLDHFLSVDKFLKFIDWIVFNAVSANAEITFKNSFSIAFNKNEQNKVSQEIGSNDKSYTYKVNTLCGYVSPQAI